LGAYGGKGVANGGGDRTVHQHTRHPGRGGEENKTPDSADLVIRAGDRACIRGGVGKNENAKKAVLGVKLGEKKHFNGIIYNRKPQREGRQGNQSADNKTAVVLVQAGSSTCKEG